ncbi:hypothetical protein [Streptomyces sp. NPDC002564]|uniref:hypothetical protein n=1 Tax=Streptomyces sp. NPDC002564 TaxID=3364649 RepID=UPI0036A0DDFB
MAVRSGSGAVGIPVWVFAVAGCVLVVGLFLGIRTVASPGGGAQGGGGGSLGGGASTGVDGGAGTPSGADGGGTTSGATSGSSAGSSDGSSDETTDGSWQTGGGDGSKGGNGNGGGGSGGQGKPPGWLPWGPKSPNTDEALEPDSAYDLLQRGECGRAYAASVDPGHERGDHASPQAWKVIEGLAGICRAAQGEPGGLGIATKAEAGLRASGYRPAGTEQLCKDGDAFTVLQHFVSYYRSHPRENVVLRSAPAGVDACADRISAKDAIATPGGSVSFYGTWPDDPDTVELRGAGLTDPIVLRPFGDADDKARCCKDGTVTVDLPGADGFGGARPTAVDVTLVTKNGVRVSRRAAFTLDWSGVVASPRTPSAALSPGTAPVGAGATSAGASGARP